MFLVLFSGAEVMRVSVVPCWECAVVLLVSSSPCFCVLCAKFIALLGLVWDVSAKKFALQAQNGRKTLFSGALGEFFREGTAERSALGDLCRGRAAGPHGACGASAVVAVTARQ